MKVLHVIKTSEGATWAARQAQVLVASGLEVHVALPSLSGEAIAYWEKAGAVLHATDCSLPLRASHRIRQRIDAIRQLVAEIAPDVIHSHFVTTTVMLRLALGKNHPIFRVFQVPGPLHMEHRLYGLLDVISASSRDYWIASSRYTRKLYLAAGVEPRRVYVSYYGTDVERFASPSSGLLRQRLGLPAGLKVVGNISYMYPPKYYLGQTVGLKGHEDLIEAVRLVCEKRSDVRGVFVGGQWGDGTWYEERLRKQARSIAGDRIVFPGRVPQYDAVNLWADFDCVVHAPLSENCGGVVEPLASAIPTVATRVGGLPEVVIDGISGWLVPSRDTRALADAMLDVLEHPAEGKRRALVGQKLVREMFDMKRTATEVVRIYDHILKMPGDPFPMFNSDTAAKQLAGSRK